MPLIETPKDQRALAKAIQDDKTIKVVKVLNPDQASKLPSSKFKDWRYVVLIK